VCVCVCVCVCVRQYRKSVEGVGNFRKRPRETPRTGIRAHRGRRLKLVYTHSGTPP